MGFFDKKSTTTTNLDETNISNVDSRAAQGENVNFGGNVSITTGVGDVSNKNTLGAGGDSGGGGINVITTDFGALDTARDIADSAFASSNSAIDKLGAVTSSAIIGATESAKTAIANVTRDEGARTTQIMIVATAVVGVALFIRLRSK